MSRDRIAEQGPWADDGDTPAPWVFDDSDNEMALVRDANGGIVASCTDGFYNDSGDWVMAAKCAPIALLIKSAPDLLAALERSLDWLSSYPGGGTLGPNGPYEQARAAIAAARGQQ